MKKNVTAIAYTALLISITALALFVGNTVDTSYNSQKEDEKRILSQEGFSYKYAGMINGEDIYEVFQDNRGKILAYRHEYQQNSFEVNKNINYDEMIYYAPLENGEITTYSGYKKFCEKMNIDPTLENIAPYYLVIFYGSTYNECSFELIDVVIDQVNEKVRVIARKIESEINGKSSGIFVAVPLDIDKEDYKIEIKRCYTKADMDEIRRYYGLQ